MRFAYSQTRHRGGNKYGGLRIEKEKTETTPVQNSTSLYEKHSDWVVVIRKYIIGPLLSPWGALGDNFSCRLCKRYRELK